MKGILWGKVGMRLLLILNKGFTLFINDDEKRRGQKPTSSFQRIVTD